MAFGLRERLVAEMPRYAPLASRVAGLANLRNRVGGVAAADRSEWLDLRRRGRCRLGGARPFRDAELGGAATPKGDVLLFADTFNRYFEPENLRAAVRVLRAAGYRAVLPAVVGRPLCCGRTYLSAGMVERARAEARRTIAALAGGLPVVGLEPSCVMTLRDEFAALVPGAAAEGLAGRAMLIGEFLATHGEGLALSAVGGGLETVRVHVHGHCHQKAFGAFPASLEVLGRVPGLEVTPIVSSCCGMAGAFGYQAETQGESRAMAEAGLLPAVRAAGAEDWVVADGTSCRHQIADLGGRAAVHSVVLLDRALGGGVLL